MSIRPIDFQVMLPKTPEVSKINEQYNQKEYIAQHNLSTDFKHQSEQSLKKVNSTKEAYKAKIDKDKKEKNKYQSKNKNSSKRENKKSQRENKNSIDILI